MESDVKDVEDSVKKWKPNYDLTPRIIVCAAIQKEGRIITGARHYDKIMHQQIAASEGKDFWKAKAEQGFIDQFGDFIDRREAWKIAEKQNQIKRKVSSPGILYSENLY